MICVLYTVVLLQAKLEGRKHYEENHRRRKIHFFSRLFAYVVYLSKLHPMWGLNSKTLRSSRAPTEPLGAHVFLFKNKTNKKKTRGIWVAQSVTTLDLGILSPNPTLGVEITLKYLFLKIEFTL